MNYQDIAQKAPKFEGYRLLEENEPAQDGDRFMYQVIYDLLPDALRAELDPRYLAPVTDEGIIKIGRSWADSRQAFVDDPASDQTPFDGVIYRLA